MLTAAELAQAEQLFEKLREITQPAPPEFTRDGKELAGLLRCNRTTSWKITKRADFQEAAPAVALGPKLKLRRTRQILAWWEAQAEGKESPGPIGPGARIAMPRRQRGTTIPEATEPTASNPDGYIEKHSRASRTRVR